MSNQQRIQNLQEKIQQLNDVSPTFCLAKWKQTTTTLYNGMTHSCHHPAQHKIHVEDIKNNPRGLHNTPIKIVARADMLKGIQTKECDYCWNIENLGQQHFSDRHYKSASENMGIWQTLEEVKASGLGENIDPTYMEIAFENTCNFKCAYCSPDVSSRWLEEVQAHGPYQLAHHTHHHLDWLKQTGRFPIHHKEYNPYIEAFWKWWPELYQSLNTFRITGGEPLLSENTWKIIDYVIANPREDFKLAINTNMNVPAKLIDRLIKSVNELEPKIREINIFTSAEGTGKQQEYSRFGMDWDVFTANCEKFLEQTPESVRLQLMTTVNLFSVSTFDKFLLWISDLRGKFNRDASHNRIGFSVSYLRWPRFLSLTLLSPDEKAEFAKRLIAVIDETNSRPMEQRLYLEEVDMIHRLIDFINSVEKDQQAEIENFSTFIDEYDRRKGTNFFETFPELVELYNRGSDGTV